MARTCSLSHNSHTLWSADPVPKAVQTAAAAALAANNGMGAGALMELTLAGGRAWQAEQGGLLPRLKT